MAIVLLTLRFMLTLGFSKVVQLILDKVGEVEFEIEGSVACATEPIFWYNWRVLC